MISLRRPGAEIMAGSLVSQQALWGIHRRVLPALGPRCSRESVGGFWKDLPPTFPTSYHQYGRSITRRRRSQLMLLEVIISNTL
jgi:hypothetical protein